MRQAVVAAVDLGASSGRVVVGRFGADDGGAATDGHRQGAVASVTEVHRFANRPVLSAGVLRWDVLALYAGVLDGLRKAEELAGPLDSVGVDSWAVDYGLLDAGGQLLGNPAHYRDGRTAPVVAEVSSGTAVTELYRVTGIQHQPFNTVFQLLADAGTGAGHAAVNALLIPDLINFWLCGVRGSELTNASTTALLDPRTGQFSAELAGRLDVPVSLFPPVHRPGVILGPMSVEACAAAGLSNRPQVIAVPSHDTAAAVAGVPADTDRFALVCTGTWALVGVELPAPVITPEAQRANFTNELGVDGTVRFLRNVTGFWLLQESVRHWRAEGLSIDLAELTRQADAVPGGRALIDVQDPRFVAPGHMPARIAAAVREAGGTAPQSPAEYARCILDSMALAIRDAVELAVQLSGRGVDVVHVVGGGVSNAVFCQLVADACGLPVLAGPTEAASWGNATSQAQALGVVPASLAAARALVREVDPPARYLPRVRAAG